MGKSIYIKIVLTVLILISKVCSAQYIKLPLDTNHYWKVEYHEYNTGNPGIYCAQNYHYKKVADTLINSQSYSIINRFGLINCCWSNSSFTCTLPPQNSRAYVLQDTISKKAWRYSLNTNSVSLLCDFAKTNIGDTVTYLYFGSPATYTVVAYDSLLLNDGLYHKRITYNNNFKIIEGVGSINGLITPNMATYSPINTGYTLLCTGKLLYNPQIYQPIYGSNCSILTSVQNSEQYNTKRLDIYPNPANTTINILAGVSFEGIQIEIFNSQGLSVFRGLTTNGTLSIKCSDWPAGLYFAKSGLLNNSARIVKE